MAHCKLGNHETEIHIAALYSYRDEKHGVDNNTSACPQCKSVTAEREKLLLEIVGAM